MTTSHVFWRASAVLVILALVVVAAHTALRYRGPCFVSDPMTSYDYGAGQSIAPIARWTRGDGHLYYASHCSDESRAD
jgi:hypothetical protein